MDFKKRCRLCFKASDCSVNVFEDGYAWLIEDLFKMKLKDHDRWPPHVCRNCQVFIEDIAEFKKLILETEKSLEQMTSTVEIILEFSSAETENRRGRKRKEPVQEERIEIPEITQVDPVGMPVIPKKRGRPKKVVRNRMKKEVIQDDIFNLPPVLSTFRPDLQPVSRQKKNCRPKKGANPKNIFDAPPMISTFDPDSRSESFKDEMEKSKKVPFEDDIFNDPPANSTFDPDTRSDIQTTKKKIGRPKKVPNVKIEIVGEDSRNQEVVVSDHVEVKLEPQAENELEDDPASEPPSNITPVVKRTCVAIRESLLEGKFPLRKSKTREDSEWKPGGQPKKQPNKGLRVFRPKAIIQAEKEEKERMRRQRDHDQWMLEKERAPLEKMMKQMGILKCPICQEAKDSFWNVGEHMVSAHNYSIYDRYIRCCGQKQTKKKVYDHMKYHLNVEEFRCKACGECAMSGVDLKKHEEDAHGEKKERPPRTYDFQCELCPKKFTFQRSLIRHLRTMHVPKQKVACDICGKELSSVRSLEEHKNKKHPEEEKSANFTCHICGKSWPTNSQLTGHVKNHEAKRSWSQCDICLKFYADVPSHKDLVHAAEVKKTECPICHNMVKEQFIKRHIKAHAAQKYTCKICGRLFRFSTGFRAHMDIHMGVRYLCHFCPETYGASSNRMKHMQRKHTEEYKQFRLEEELQRRGKNPYEKDEGCGEQV